MSNTNNCSRPITICLYQAIPQHFLGRRHRPRFSGRVKSSVRASFDRFATAVSGRLFLNDYHYLRAAGLIDNLNKGDIGIGLAVQQQLSTAFLPRATQFIEFGWGSLDESAVAEINSTCDLFVIGGGGFIFIDAQGNCGPRLSELHLLEKIQCPIVAYGIGLNRLMHEEVCSVECISAEAQQQIGRFAALCRLAGVRDPDTQTLLERYSQSAPQLIGDPALFLGPQEIPVRGRGGRERIGLNLAAHGWRAISVLRRSLPSIVHFLAGLMRQGDFELVYFLHHELERPVFAMLKRRGLPLRLVDATPRSMLAEYAQTEFVICQMLHSCIFAANVGVPFLNIAYDTKSLAFARLMEVQECALPFYDASASSLRTRFAHLYRQRGVLAETIRRRKIDLEKAVFAFTSQISELVQ